MTLTERRAILVLNRIAHPLVPEAMPGIEFLIVPANPAPVVPEGAAGRIEAIMARLPGEVSAATIAALPRLRIISAAGVGVQNIDIAAATQAGVMVVNHPGHGHLSVAEHAVGLLLSVSRRIGEIERALRARGWAARDAYLDRVSDGFGTVLHGQRLGIVGLGHVGRHIARICGAGLGMRVWAYSPSAPDSDLAALGIERCADLDALCAQSDAVMMAGAYRPGAPPVLGRAQIARMKRTAYLINVARGQLVDQDALYEALRDGAIAAAGIDVFHPEPPPAAERLLTLENVVATPHVAGPSMYSAVGLARSNVDQVRMALDGQRPPHLINPEVWDRRRPR